MKKSIIRTLVLLAVVFGCVLGASCGGGGDDTGKTTEYTITFELNGGTLTSQLSKYDGKADITLPTPKKEGFEFAGWYEKADFSGSKVTKIVKGTTGDKKFYAKWNESAFGATAKWALNQIGFNGNGMVFGIKCLPVAEFDPLNAQYTGDSKALKQAHLAAVESAYNVDIQYIAYGDDEQWGPVRVKAINESYLDGSYLNENIYVVNISTQWIPTLNKGGSLAALYNVGTDTGYFKDAGYVQNTAINQAVTVQKNAYGYEPGAARPDYFLYYNATKAAEIGMADPAELWLTGQWNVTTFDQWVKEAQAKLGDEEYAIDCGYAEYSIGAVAARGLQMINPTRATVNFTGSSITAVFDEMQSYYRTGLWDTKHGVQDVATNFKAGKTLLQTGSLWFLKEPTRFTPAEMDGGIDFEIGVVPYPVAYEQYPTVYTEPYEYVNTEGNIVSVTEPLTARDGNTLKDSMGREVYGVDYTTTTYQIPYTGGTCYSFMNYDSTPSGMNSNVAFRIMHDLESGMIEDPELAELTLDERYENYLSTKFDNAIDINVVMSVQADSLSYYELMEFASMIVGDGSHFGSGYWAFCSQLITGSDTPAIKLQEIKGQYEDALTQIGIY